MIFLPIFFCPFFRVICLDNGMSGEHFLHVAVQVAQITDKSGTGTYLGTVLGLVLSTDVHRRQKTDDQ